MSAGWGSVSSWGSLLDFLAHLLGALVMLGVKESVWLPPLGSFSLGSLLNRWWAEQLFWGHLLDVLQEERLISLKIGVTTYLKGNESFLPWWGRGALPPRSPPHHCPGLA